MWGGQTATQFKVTVLQRRKRYYHWPKHDLSDLTVENFSSEQDRRYTTDMMILLLKCAAPVPMPPQRFKNNHRFMRKSFLNCHVSDLIYDTTICTVGDNTDTWMKTNLQSKVFNLTSDHTQPPQIGMERWTLSPGSLSRRWTRKILLCWRCFVGHNCKKKKKKEKKNAVVN